MMQDGLGQSQVAIPEEVIIRRVPEQRTIVRRDDLQVIRFIGGNHSIKVFINRGTDHYAPIVGVVGLQIGATPSKTDAHWSSSN